MSGPLFDGRAAAAARGMTQDIEQAVAQEAEAEVQRLLASSLQHPTGRYQSSIRVERQGGQVEVNDGGVVYGPWLAGTSSRNQTTRFKGYQTWRRATAALSGRVDEIARPVVDRWRRRME